MLTPAACLLSARVGDGKSLRNTEVTAVPCRKYAGSFTPEQLEILTRAFNAAIADLTTAGVEIPQSDLARRILDRAADGICDADELKRAALSPDWQRNGQKVGRVTGHLNDATPVPQTPQKKGPRGQATKR
jgi:hypothetical protein